MRYSESKAMWEEVIVRSGEVWYLLEETRGESRLRRRKSEYRRDFVLKKALQMYILSESTRQGYGH